MHVEFLSPDCSEFRLLKRLRSEDGGYAWTPEARNYLYAQEYERNLGLGVPTYTHIRVVSASDYDNRAITPYPIEVKIDMPRLSAPDYWV